LGKAEFTTTDAYIFERELEQLHPDNRNIKANPVNSDTGRGFASNFRNFAPGICFCMLTVTTGVCREHFFNAKTQRRKVSESLSWRLRAFAPLR